MPAIEYQVVDAYKNVLFDNRQHDMIGTWDFTLESSQQLKIVVKVPVSAQKTEFPNSGCVSIMFGFQEEEIGIKATKALRKPLMWLIGLLRSRHCEAHFLWAEAISMNRQYITAFAAIFFQR